MSLGKFLKIFLVYLFLHTLFFSDIYTSPRLTESLENVVVGNGNINSSNLNGISSLSSASNNLSSVVIPSQRNHLNRGDLSTISLASNSSPSLSSSGGGSGGGGGLETVDTKDRHGKYIYFVL